ncbi:unnamed protein product [Calypogeia fissa]
MITAKHRQALRSNYAGCSVINSKQTSKALTETPAAYLPACLCLSALACRGLLQSADEEGCLSSTLPCLWMGGWVVRQAKKHLSEEKKKKKQRPKGKSSILPK